MDYQVSDRYAHGGDVSSYPHCVDYSSSSNPLGTPPGVIEGALRSLEDLRSYPQPYARDLCRAIAGKAGVHARECLCSNGAAQLFMTLALAKKARRALLAAPCFSEYERAVLAAGGEVLYFDRPLGGGRQWEDVFLRKLEVELEGGDLVFLCNPNNPDGYLYAPQFLRRVLRLCEQKKLSLVLDECFLELSPEGEGASLIPCIKESKALVIVRAFTKTYAMASLRLGYCLSSDQELLERMRAMMQPWEVSGIALAAGLEALKEEEYCLRSRKVVFEEREYLQKGFLSLGYTLIPSSANFLLFQGPLGLRERCIEKGFLLRDASNFRGLSPGWLRICVRLREENKALLDALYEIGQEGFSLKEEGGTLEEGDKAREGGGESHG